MTHLRDTYHYCDVIMGAMESQITSLSVVYSIIHSGADQRKHKSSSSLTFVLGIHQWPVNSPHKWPVTRKMFPFDDVIMHISGVAVLSFVFHNGKFYSYLLGLLYLHQGNLMTIQVMVKQPWMLRVNTYNESSENVDNQINTKHSSSIFYETFSVLCLNGGSEVLDINHICVETT